MAAYKVALLAHPEDQDCLHALIELSTEAGATCIVSKCRLRSPCDLKAVVTYDMQLTFNRDLLTSLHAHVQGVSAQE